MESSNSELNRTRSAPLEHDHDIISTPATFPSLPTQCPSSLDDQTQENEVTSSPYKATSAPIKRQHETTARLKTFSSEKISCPSSSSPSSSDDRDNQTYIVSTEAPRTQEMERTPSGYRIPPSVFERSETSSPMEWSTTSNESLFSIHMGNMSFTNDQFYMWRSGELTPPPVEASTSDQMFTYNFANGVVEGDMSSHEMGLAEATMLEVIKESKNQNQTKLTLNEVRNARRSQGSNTSNKSFAFSIMGAETGSSTRLRSSIKSNHEQMVTQTQPEAQIHAESEAQIHAESEAHAQPNPETPIETENQAKSSWLSCFSCCSIDK